MNYQAIIDNLNLSELGDKDKCVILNALNAFKTCNWLGFDAYNKKELTRKKIEIISAYMFEYKKTMESLREKQPLDGNFKLDFELDLDSNL